MLKLMRDSFAHLKWILLAVVVAFIFGFVFIDMGLGGAMGGGAPDDGGQFAARVNGETVTFSDFNRALKRYEDMYRQMYGGQFTPEMSAALRLPNQVMETLVDQRLLAQEADRLNLTATPEEVRKKLLEIPIFTQDGKFIGMELYTRYVTGPLGYTSANEFEEDIAREIELTKMDSALTSSVVVSPKAADAEYRRINENAKIRYVLIPAAAQAATITVTPAEVEAYYRNNQQKYQHGEQRTFRYLLGDYAKIRQTITPGDETLRQRYDAARDQYATPEAARVLHILVKVEPNSAPAVDAAARAKAEGLVAQLRAGADFAALARANSEDPSSAGNGGDMGFVDRGQTVEPFDNAIFSLPLNQISDPIRSADYGYHIVKVLGRRPAGTRTFEEVKPELSARVANELAQEQAQNEINRLATIMRSNKPNLTQFSAYQNEKATANDSGWFQKSDPIPGLGNHQPLAEWVFSAKNDDVSPVIGTPRGPVVAYLQDLRPGGVTPLAEIRPRVEEDARAAKAADAAKSALASFMTGGATIEQLAQKAATTIREASVSRQGSVPGLTGDLAALVDAAIGARLGEVKGPVSMNEGAVAFQVVEQKKVTEEELKTSRPAFIDNLRSQHARNLRQALLKRLRTESKIEINQELVNTARAPQQAGL